MNPILRTLILGGLVLAGAIYGVNYHNDTVARLEFEKGQHTLRAAYAERAGWIFSIADEDRYRDELMALIKWYDASLADLHNRYPGRAPPSPLKDLEAQAAAGQLKPDELAIRKEFLELTEYFHKSIESGRYAPLFTHSTNGVRVDITGIRREPHEGRQALRVDLVVWGAPRREITAKQDGGKQVTARMQLDFGVKELTMEFIDEKAKLYGEFKAGAPTMVVDYPERWVPGFPPQAALATYWIEPIPREAATLDLTLSGELRSPASGPLPWTLERKITPQPEWQLKEGEAFQAEERVMPEEDMDRSAAGK